MFSLFCLAPQNGSSTIFLKYFVESKIYKFLFPNTFQI